MKNTIKMSLVAAVAVAGLSSTAAAKPLEEAIKNVDVSGSIVYRYNDYGDDKNVKNKTDNNYKIAASLKSKVNDYVTATVRVVTGHDIATGTQNTSSSWSTLPTDTNADANPTVQVSQANFTVKTDAATVIAGKQGLTTPWTVAIDSDGNEQHGTGLLALIPAGPVTIAAAYFNQTNLDNVKPSILAGGALDGAAYIATVGVLGSASGVSFDAWALDLEDTFSSYTFGAKTTMDMITAELRYASLDLDAVDTNNSIVIAKVGAKMDAFSAYLQYGMTDEEGGLTALDSDAKTTMTGWNTNIHDKADADYIRVGGAMDVMSDLNVSLNYATLDYTGDVTETELYTQITHKMGKNLSTYVRLGMWDKETGSATTFDSTAGRLQVEYKF